VRNNSTLLSLFTVLAIALTSCSTSPAPSGSTRPPDAPTLIRLPAEVAGVQALAQPELVTPVFPSLQEQAADLQPQSTFAERAMRIVRALAYDVGIRPAGTDAERQAAAFLAEEFRAMGYTVQAPEFRFSSRSGSGVSQNVVASDPNEDPNLPLVIIGGHYDSVPMGPGANDNASGTGVTVEVARDLMQHPVPGVAVRFIAFGAEEVGLLGSAEYVRTLSAADRQRTRVMMSLDMLAVGDQPAFGGSDPYLSEALARAASQGYRPAELSNYLRRMSDHASFLDVGIPAIMFHWVDDPNYHTRFDVPEYVQPYSLELMGAIAVELVRVAAR
jgi:hypothetical protein